MKYMEEIFVMISIMSDDIPSYDFNLLKHRAIASIDKSAKRKRVSKKTRAK